MSRWTVLVALLGLAACDFGDPGRHTPEPVVEAWLIAGEQLPQIRVSWTQAVDRVYDNYGLGVQDAAVTVSVRAEGGSPGRDFVYRRTAEPGHYVPEFAAAPSVTTVEPGRTYDLSVLIPGYPEVSASTVVPGAFDIGRVNNQSVVYQSTDQVEIDVTKSRYPEREAVYIISIESLEPSIEALTPFLRDAIYGIGGGEDFDPSDLDPEELDDVLAQSSPPLNEANWEVNADGTIRLKMPWFFVAFYGENRITASAIDDNVWEYFKHVNAQEGNGGLAPGEIPNVRAGVSGGHGLFGSLTRVSAVVDILRDGSPTASR